MASLIRIIIVLASLGSWASTAVAQASGEAGEPTPEAIDAAFTAEDAARVAAGFSDAATTRSLADPLDNMAGKADLVFRGTVVAQAYEYDIAGVPHTHTTFSITESLKGEHSSSQLTLVQPGGPARDGSDRVMMVSDAHYFNVGEEELLFMSLDPQNPYATRRVTVNSRFRILRDRVYTEDGYGVTVQPHAEGSYRLVLAGRRSAEQRFGRINIGPHRLDKRFVGKDGPDSLRESVPRPLGEADPRQVEAASAVDVAAFSELIRRQVVGER